MLGWAITLGAGNCSVDTRLLRGFWLLKLPIFVCVCVYLFLCVSMEVNKISLVALKKSV